MLLQPLFGDGLELGQGLLLQLPHALAGQAHEVADLQGLFAQLGAYLRPDAQLLLVEPRFHVTAAAFDRMVEMAKEVGLRPAGWPRIVFSRAVVLGKT